ncbi:MAG TPA: DoxX family protein [Actinomycetota bacterium]|nr:DoxX family protein [Actinomycetota bacterium]
MNFSQRFDRVAVGLARRHGITALRMALGIVFIWFGALKVAGTSPVAALVADVVPLVEGDIAVLIVGIVEIAVGLGLITGIAIRLTLGLFFLQMLGTFLVLVTEPGRSFEEGNPLRLTVLGEFVVKNLVLLTAGLTVAASIPRPTGDERLAEMLIRPAARDTEITSRDDN